MLIKAFSVDLIKHTLLLCWRYIRPCFTGILISTIKIKRSWDRLIFIMGISVLVRRYFHIETVPKCHDGKWLSFIEPFFLNTFIISSGLFGLNCAFHDDVIKWKHFPRYLPFVQGIHRSPVNSPHKGQWCRALMFSLICACINGWVNKREAGDLRRHCQHYDVTMMF